MYSYTFGYIVRQMVNLRFPILSSLATPLPPDPPVSKLVSVSSGVLHPFHYPHFPCNSDAFGLQTSHNGSAINSSSRSNGRVSQRNTTHGRMWRISTQTMAHDSCRKKTRISTWRRTSTEDTLMHHNRRTLQTCTPNQLNTGGYEDSPRGCWTLGGGYCNEYCIFRTLPTPSNTPWPSPTPPTLPPHSCSDKGLAHAARKTAPTPPPSPETPHNPSKVTHSL
jgi:hypothetical protein